MNNRDRIDRLNAEKSLPRSEWRELIASFSPEDRAYARSVAAAVTAEHFGNRVFFRGIIEFSNLCRNDCLYCGIRRSNRCPERYRLSEEEILLCCREGYRLGYRTFVLQGGEDAFCASPQFTALIRRIRERWPDCAVTLSVGEWERDVYEKMFEAGAERYLLRHETADRGHYGKLHPAAMSLDNRLRCLDDLRDIGFQVGCGMMVGTPYQSPDTLAEDMVFMSGFRPEMAGIGPFLPHRETPFADFPAGSQELTLFLLSLTRIMLPQALIPATTALGTAAEDGRIQGVLAGCNVVMPNLSPLNVRKNYMLYNNKSGTELSAEESLLLLKKQMESVGREMVVGRGDHPSYERKDRHRD